MSVQRLRIGVDIGGTFTDVTVMDTGDGSVTFGKALSTPDDLVRGIFDAIAVTACSPSDADFIIHGSTVAINAILERKGANTALVTTQGFRDVYEIGRVNRPDSFNLFFRKHVPLIPRALRFEVRERMHYDGSVETPLDEGARRRADRQDEGVESVAVVFLHSYVNVAHEERMVEMLREAMPDGYITASHQVSREQREYERISTIVANAYVGPCVSTYLERFERGSRARLRGQPADHAVQRWSLRRCDGARAVHPDARVGSGGRRRRVEDDGRVAGLETT